MVELVYHCEDLPKDLPYVGSTNLSNEWHRHVLRHGPKPEAYDRYTLALIELEERMNV